MKIESAYKLIGSIDTNLTEAFVKKIAKEDWYVYDYRKTMGFTDCESIMLRHSPEYQTDTIRNLVLFEKYEQELQNIIAHLRNFYLFKDYVAFMAKLEPQGRIHMHVDGGEFLETIHRVHIPLQTNSDCFYLMDGDRVNMKVGKIYEIDNTRKHGVENNGSDYRIHLIVNLYPERNN